MGRVYIDRVLCSLLFAFLCVGFLVVCLYVDGMCMWVSYSCQICQDEV